MVSEGDSFTLEKHKSLGVGQGRRRSRLGQQQTLTIHEHTDSAPASPMIGAGGLADQHATLNSACRSSSSITIRDSTAQRNSTWAQHTRKKSGTFSALNNSSPGLGVSPLRRRKSSVAARLSGGE
ncbi:hypothetical protein SARC_04623 [Sphaeroforma arctica JP610]|uniref:Uncharacterized protein n=1 Tax=Sphaeroforma arctica JP610 TaxID=667725 RepID=A0A0L0G2N5_9EUKA|nr:hypothetical protein SARC_04623 [Sphaeroforma arctica JP610]KNC83104.1 hypothetical protein SARC_04623 [Sphaeroforma arctica JP610]|eukprot:XP_014157006.1 hypothetical protein SARC_04623 [Sphaeroforma arctica JP610]